MNVGLEHNAIYLLRTHLNTYFAKTSKLRIHTTHIPTELISWISYQYRIRSCH